jgi:hypothetical protein
MRDGGPLLFWSGSHERPDVLSICWGSCFRHGYVARFEAKSDVVHYGWQQATEQLLVVTADGKCHLFGLHRELSGEARLPASVVKQGVYQVCSCLNVWI